MNTTLEKRHVYTCKELQKARSFVSKFLNESNDISIAYNSLLEEGVLISKKSFKDAMRIHLIKISEELLEQERQK